jgi:hypothetical protein
MLGKLVWLATRSFNSAACAANAGGAGMSVATMASPPSSARASRASATLRRSAKKPTAVSAATASITATSSKRSSPARRSRRIWRQAIAATLMGRGCAAVGSAMGGNGTPARTNAPPDPAIGLKTACSRVQRRPGAAVL